MLDQREYAVGHEAGAAHDAAAAGHLGHRDHVTDDRYLNPATGPGRHHLVGPRLAARVHHDFHPIALHRRPLRFVVSWAEACALTQCTYKTATWTCHHSG